jgi:RimJ/RimL family protein N-acetyltransferase
MQVDRLINEGKRIQTWMHERSGLPIMRDFHGIAREVRGEIVAAFGYDSFQPGGCQLHLCVDKPSGINRELLLRAFHTPFQQWNYQYLLAIIQVQNFKSLNMADRLGFKLFGEVPGHLRFGVMYRNDCRWLKLGQR